MGNRLADDGVQGDQNGQGNETPEAAAHGADALFFVELLHLLIHFCLIVGILLLDLLHLAGHAVHPDHALLGLDLEGQHDELDDNGEQNDSQTVGIGQVVKQLDQRGEGDTNVVSKG